MNEGIGTILRAKRKILGLNQAQVAEMIGLTQATVSSVERGETQSIKTIKDILNALQLEPEKAKTIWKAQTAHIPPRKAHAPISKDLENFIRLLCEIGFPDRIVAEMCDVSVCSVQVIKKGADEYSKIKAKWSAKDDPEPSAEPAPEQLVFQDVMVSTDDKSRKAIKEFFSTVGNALIKLSEDM